MVSDEALMLEFRGGSRETFEEIFAHYRAPLYGFFRRRLDSRDRAEDLGAVLSTLLRLATSTGSSTP